MRIIDFTNYQEIDRLIDREDTDTSSEYEEVVAEIILNVRKNGDAALSEYSKKLDNCDLTDFAVSEAEIDYALEQIEPEFLEVLKQSAENIRAYHVKQKQQGYEINEDNGIILGRRVTPLKRVGVYIPGGTASYPSTVLMNVVPAKIAGVDEIVLITPPNKDGKIAPEILVAAHITGVDKIYKLGGAQGIAALAYGTQSIPQVDKIVGPGNIYVATAKKQVFGQVDIDMIAGPSEILIIADADNNPDYIAIDLLSQAEHDVLSACILLTTSRELAEKVSTSVNRLLNELDRKDIARKSVDRGGLIVVAENLEQCVDISNYIAPEHLEICTEKPFVLLELVRNAGSIFLGKYTPEALGDYFAGPNHTLPTSGTARFSSGLSVEDFVKKSSYIYYEKEALMRHGKAVEMFALKEGLDAHAKSVSMRMEADKNE